MSKISIGDLCQVIPYDASYAKVGVRVVGKDEGVVWIPKGSRVLITQTLENGMGDIRWCHVMFEGHHVEIGTDLLEPIK